MCAAKFVCLPLTIDPSLAAGSHPPYGLLLNPKVEKRSVMQGFSPPHPRALPSYEQRYKRRRSGCGVAGEACGGLSPSPERRQQAVDDTMAPDLEDDIKDEKNPRLLEEDDIALLKTYEEESMELVAGSGILFNGLMDLVGWTLGCFLCIHLTAGYYCRRWSRISRILESGSVSLCQNRLRFENLSLLFVKNGQPVEGSLSAEQTSYEGDWVG